MTFEESEIARKAFFRYLNRWPHLGYAWCLERSFTRGFQYQLIVFLDAQNKNDVLAAAAALGEFWRTLGNAEKKKLTSGDAIKNPMPQLETDVKRSVSKKYPPDLRRYVIYDVIRQKYNHTDWRSHYFCGRVSRADKNCLDELCLQMTMPAYLLR